MEETFRIFAAIATAIVIEALPFLALGSLLSALVEVFVSRARIAALAPGGTVGRIAVGVGAGMALPTCECGVVPVARRLLTKGTPPSTVVAYLLAAPIVNPVVLASTWFAFRGSMRMVVARAAVAALVAGVVAWQVRRARAEDLLRASPEDASHAHDHGASGRSPMLVLRHAGADFLDMGKYLVLGAFAAAAFKALLPLGAMQLVEGSLVLSVSGMMALAVLLSVCSEADAFVAASFVTLPAAAHLAFVTIGPMVDVKLIALYAVTFRRRLVVALVVIPLVLVFVLCMAFGLLA